MSLLRKTLLAGSTNPWLRERATRTTFVRKSVARFMPGERIEDAIRAAAELKPQGITTILTKLGENLESADEFEEVTQHYLEVLDRIAAAGLDAHISVKPTQLGLDLDPALCERNLARLVAHAEERGNFVWIDMESSGYVDRTIALFRQMRAQTPRVGIALQAYLYRTEKDVESLVPLGAAIRIVKGAYLEPPEVAFPEEGGRRRELLQAVHAAAGAGCAPAGRASAHRDPRHPAGGQACRAHCAGEGAGVRLRVCDVVRHTTGAAGTACGGWDPAARPHQLRRVLVPVVHAPPCGTAREYLVRRTDDVRVECRNRQESES